MENTKILEKIVKYYGIIFSVLTVVVGGLFIWQVLDVYFSRRLLEEIFTRQIVIERLNNILIPVIIWIVLAVTGIVLWAFLPQEKFKLKLDNVYVLNRLKKRMPSSPKAGLETEFAFVKKEEKKIRYIRLACALYVVAVAIYGLIYLLIPSNFTELANATKEVVKMVKYVYPFIAIGFIACVGATVYEGISAKKQLDAVKKLVAGEKGNQEVIKSNEKPIMIARICLLVLGVAFVIWGILNGGMHDVFVKAINICTECIGLG